MKNLLKTESFIFFLICTVILPLPISPNTRENTRTKMIIHEGAGIEFSQPKKVGINLCF